MWTLPLTALCSALLAAAAPGRAGAVPLDGTWLASEQELPQAPRSLPEGQDMPVPSNWYRHGIDRGGVVWFSREVSLPAGERFRLEFDGVDYEGRDFWDGQEVGQHRGYAVFQFMFVEHWPSMNWGVVDSLRQPKEGYA